MPYRTSPPAIGPTASFQLANHTLPHQARDYPTQLWSELLVSTEAGWVAVSDELREVRMAEEAGSRAIVRDRFELLVVCFPKPRAAGEPHFAVFARRAGEVRLRTFVFE